MNYLNESKQQRVAIGGLIQESTYISAKKYAAENRMKLSQLYDKAICEFLDSKKTNSTQEANR